MWMAQSAISGIKQTGNLNIMLWQDALVRSDTANSNALISKDFSSLYIINRREQGKFESFVNHFKAQSEISSI